MIREPLEAIPFIELSCRLIDRMYDDELDPDLLRDSHAGSQSVREQRASHALALNGLAAGEPCKENARHGVLEGCGKGSGKFFAYEAVGSLGVVAIDPALTLFHKHARQRRAPLGGLVGLLAQPVVQVIDSTVERGPVVGAGVERLY